ncbi:MAG: DUF433 domain-containing protein [Pararhizobium sp.]
MSNPGRNYTAAEAAVVSNVAVKSVHNAIDKRIIQPRFAAGSARPSTRILNAQDLLELKLWYGVGSILTADRRKRLFDAIKAKPLADKINADDLLIIDVAEARRQVESRIKDLEEAEETIHSVKGVMGGEPVFKGTRIPVRMITSMLADGANEAELLEGYPKLTSSMLALARLWVAAHPSRGRPKRLSEQGLVPKSTTSVTLKGDPRSLRSKKFDEQL